MKQEPNQRFDTFIRSLPVPLLIAICMVVVLSLWRSLAEVLWGAPMNGMDYLMSLITPFTALCIFSITWIYYQQTLKLSSRNNYMKELNEIDKLCIANPELWAIYDDHIMANAKSNQCSAMAKREAFIYYHFNLFEMVINDYTNVLPKTKINQDYWMSWKQYIQHFFDRSSEARTIFNKDDTAKLYSSEFVTFIHHEIVGIRPKQEVIHLPPSSPEEWLEMTVFIHGVTPEMNASKHTKDYNDLFNGINKHLPHNKKLEDQYRIDVEWGTPHNAFQNQDCNLSTAQKTIYETIDTQDKQHNRGQGDIWWYLWLVIVGIVAVTLVLFMGVTQSLFASCFFCRALLTLCIIGGGSALLIASLRKWLLTFAFRTIRRYFVCGFSDMAYYFSVQGEISIRNTVFEAIITGIENKIQGQSHPKVSLTMIAHSGGAVILHDFLYYCFRPDKTCRKYTNTRVNQFLERLSTPQFKIRRVFTMASPISPTILRNNTLIKTSPIQLNPAHMGLFREQHGQGPRWINVWDVNDFISAPISFLYDDNETNPLIKDIHVQLPPYIPGIVHNSYWSADIVARHIAEYY